MLRPIVSASADVLLPRAERSRLGQPLWTLPQWLSDLELRLGIVASPAPASIRVQRYAARMRSLLEDEPYYRRAFELDPVNTARSLLARRDELMLAGWNGQPLATGGPRVEALAALELLIEPIVPAGIPDRARLVERMLGEAQRGPYESVTLLDPRVGLPMRWRRLLTRLEALGVPIVERPPAHAPLEGDSDLARIQRVLAGDRSNAELSGDGSVRLFRAETPIEAAALAAHWASSQPASDSGAHDHMLLVAGPEAHLLDAAFADAGLPTFGASCSSRNRGLLSVLPLALSSSAWPPDPSAVLTLLTIDGGPFTGAVGAKLARALSMTPAVGSPAWQRARADLVAAGHDLGRVTTWLETRGPPRSEPAPKEHWVAVARRVLTWANGELANNDGGTNAVLSAAVVATETFIAVLDDDDRDRLTMHELLLLAEDATPSVVLAQAIEESGRVAACSDPSGLLADAETVIWWGFCDVGGEGIGCSWTSSERSACAAAGVELVKPRDEIQRLWERARRPFFAARARIVLVVPDVLAGEARGPHPMWDEIAAFANISEPARARMTTRAADCVRDVLKPLPLPQVTPVLQLSMPAIGPGLINVSVSGLESFLACPLRWLLGSRLRLERDGGPRLASGPRLYGTLAHRLFELLHLEGKLASADRVRVAAERFAELLENEAQSLLIEDSFVLADLEEQLVGGVLELCQRLDEGGLQIESVELPLEREIDGFGIRGRADLIVRDRTGAQMIIDLKWGGQLHQVALRTQLAVQLAAYSGMLAESPAAQPDATYFLIAGRKLLPRSEMRTTSAKLFPTLALLKQKLALGTVLVPAIEGARPLIEELATPADQVLTLARDHACKYCQLDALCGRRWERDT